ncbi:hypothetical protein RSAG8_01608, partial [Rhizoctonia solani AG-8 WAC10335]
MAIIRNRLILPKYILRSCNTKFRHGIIGNTYDQSKAPTMVSLRALSGSTRSNVARLPVDTVCAFAVRSRLTKALE